MTHVRTHTNSIHVESRGYRNTFVVRIVGFFGQGTFYRRSHDDALATAERYTRLFDGPKTSTLVTE